MRIQIALLTMITVGCTAVGFAQSRPQHEARRGKPESIQDQVSYVVGLNLATSLKKQGIPVDPERIMQGLLDGLSGEPVLSEEEVRNATAIFEKQNKGKDRSDKTLVCEIYHELTTHPDLKDFPVMVSNITNGYATLMGVAEVRWAQARAGGGLSNTFDQIETQRRKAKTAQSAASRVTGKETAWREFSDASEEQVRQWAENGMKLACAPL